MDKIWLKHYPKGVPAEIDPDIYQSISEIFEQSCQVHAALPALYNFGVTITYQALYDHSRKFAIFLQKVLKLQKGDRLAIMLPNLLQYPIAMFGALQAGVIIVNVNPLYTADELAHQLNDSGAQAVLVLTQFAETVQKAKPYLKTLKHIILTEVGDYFPPSKRIAAGLYTRFVLRSTPPYHLPDAIFLRQALKKADNLSFDPVPLHNQEIAFLQYTGGTTGISKGAILTHRNLIANILQADAWLKSILVENKEIVITALPLYHVFSLMANCLYFTKLGGLNILITNPRDLPSMIKQLRKFKFTAMTGVNTLFNALLKNKDFLTLDFSQLKFVLGGGMAVQQKVAEEWKVATHVTMLQGYGLSETSPCITLSPVTLKSFDGSVGLPVPSTEVRIVNNERGEQPLTVPGEIQVRGPQVMQGYWNQPDETARVLSQDGWFATGDIGSIDENGFLRLLERKKDMILVSGFNVYPNEVEDVIARLPGVREVAVIGVPDEGSGEVPKAFIVSDDPTLSSESIITFCHEHLTRYKVPKYIEFAQELPKSNVGKILRRQLKALVHG